LPSRRATKNTPPDPGPGRPPIAAHTFPPKSPGEGVGLGAFRPPDPRAYRPPNPPKESSVRIVGAFRPGNRSRAEGDSRSVAN
jgi:hypothetical protein